MIRIVHAYPSLMNMYGEYANVKLLVKRLEASGEEVTVVNLERDNHMKLDDKDFLFVGAGTELKMLTALKDFCSYRDELLNMLERGGHILATGNAGCLFLENIEDEKHGGSYKGLNLLEGNGRIVQGRRYSEVVCESPLVADRVIGVINSSVDYSYCEGERFCRILKDSDGRLTGCKEGFISGGIYATEITGPLLYRNPFLLNYFASLVAENKLSTCEESWWKEEVAAYLHVNKILEETIE